MQLITTYGEHYEHFRSSGLCGINKMEIAIIVLGLIAAMIVWRVYVIRKKHKAIDRLTQLYMKSYEVPDKYYLHVRAVVDTAYNRCSTSEEFVEHVKWRITDIKNGGGVDNNGNADTG